MCYDQNGRRPNMADLYKYLDMGIKQKGLLTSWNQQNNAISPIKGFRG